jgi:hypothetical protein
VDLLRRAVRAGPLTASLPGFPAVAASNPVPLAASTWRREKPESKCAGMERLCRALVNGW